MAGVAMALPACRSSAPDARINGSAGLLKSVLRAFDLDDAMPASDAGTMAGQCGPQRLFAVRERNPLFVVLNTAVRLFTYGRILCPRVTKRPCIGSTRRIASTVPGTSKTQAKRPSCLRRPKRGGCSRSKWKRTARSLRPTRRRKLASRSPNSSSNRSLRRNRPPQLVASFIWFR
jgi:hypothetical protein